MKTTTTKATGTSTNVNMRWLRRPSISRSSSLVATVSSLASSRASNCVQSGTSRAMVSACAAGSPVHHLPVHTLPPSGRIGSLRRPAPRIKSAPKPVVGLSAGPGIPRGLSRTLILAPASRPAGRSATSPLAGAQSTGARQQHPPGEVGPGSVAPADGVGPRGGHCHSRKPFRTAGAPQRRSRDSHDIHNKS